MAARAGQMEVVRCLLRNGALVDAMARVSQLSLFPFFFFFSFSQTNTFFSVAQIIQPPQLWLSPQLYSNLCNLFILQPQEDQTPLHIASRLGKTDIVQLLLQHMAHPDAATTNGYTPLHISAREGQLETAAVLLEAGASHSLPTKVSIR